jgi:hypothetical protein
MLIHIDPHPIHLHHCPPSVADPAAPSAPPAEDKVSPGPACPGIVRNRHKGVLSRLPPGSDILEEFAQLRRDHYLSDEEALLRLMTTYDMSLATLNRISSNVYPALLRRNLSA